MSKLVNFFLSVALRTRQFITWIITTPFLGVRWIYRLISGHLSNATKALARIDVVRQLEKIPVVSSVIIVHPRTEALIVVVNETLDTDIDSISGMKRMLYQRLEKAGCQDVELIILYQCKAYKIG